MCALKAHIFFCKKQALITFALVFFPKKMNQNFDPFYKINDLAKYVILKCNTFALEN